MGGDQIVAALVGEGAEETDGDAIRDGEGEAYDELIGELRKDRSRLASLSSSS